MNSVIIVMYMRKVKVYDDLLSLESLKQVNYYQLFQNILSERNVNSHGDSCKLCPEKSVVSELLNIIPI